MSHLLGGEGGSNSSSVNPLRLNSGDTTPNDQSKHFIYKRGNLENIEMIVNMSSYKKYLQEGMTREEKGQPKRYHHPRIQR